MKSHKGDPIKTLRAGPDDMLRMFEDADRCEADPASPHSAPQAKNLAWWRPPTKQRDRNTKSGAYHVEETFVSVGQQETASEASASNEEFLKAIDEISRQRERVRQVVTQLILAEHSRPTTAIINGTIQSFASVEETFEALVSEWRRERTSGSSTAPLVNDAYGQIVAMGWQVIPLLLREVERESGHWFTALKWITRADVASPAIRGNIRALREAWLQWGKNNGLYVGRGGTELASGKSSESGRGQVAVH